MAKTKASFWYHDLASKVSNQETLKVTNNEALAQSHALAIRYKCKDAAAVICQTIAACEPQKSGFAIFIYPGLLNYDHHYTKIAPELIGKRRRGAERSPKEKEEKYKHDLAKIAIKYRKEIEELYEHCFPNTNASESERRKGALGFRKRMQAKYWNPGQTEKVEARATDQYTGAQDLDDVRASIEKEATFDPRDEEDARKRTLGLIVQRQGRGKFRRTVVTSYNCRCAITGCTAEDVLEAAHIFPYKGKKTDHPSNGILLRSDFHTLFDLHLVSIDEGTMKLLVSSKLDGTEYERYRGAKVYVPKEKSRQPNRQALKQHRMKIGLGRCPGE